MRRHRQGSVKRDGALSRHRIGIISAACVAVVALLATGLIFTLRQPQPPGKAADPRRHTSFVLPTAASSYLGLYQESAPHSYGGITAFMNATGVAPNLVTYYSGWLEPFQTTFASDAVGHGAVPLVQIDPSGIDINAIATGQYDSYLTTYAEAVRAYHHPVILSFGHEMNGYWYSWGYKQSSPSDFVAAWRHMVTLFRALGVKNVTWLWTVNTVHPRGGVPSPGPWWPGNSYVNWVGIDGYYFQSSQTFVSSFGPTIAAVRAFTKEPILIAETAAARSTGQPDKIAELFAGVRTYGLLGFVWFDSEHVADWRLSSPAAIAAFGRAAKADHALYKPPHAG
jgi:mannan endo-1,4-beta-mannosidase